MSPLPEMVQPGKLANALGGYVRALRPRRHHLPGDVSSGLTQAFAMVPEGMAAALLARVNPIHGLYAGMFGPMFGALGTSSVLINVSTTAALAVGAREALGAHGGASAIVTLTVLVGLFQLVGALLRVGRMTRYVSNAVMTGFLSGLGVIIILSQLEDVTGVHGAVGHRLMKVVALGRHPGRIDPATAIVAAATIALVVGLERTRLRTIAMALPLVAATVAVPLLGWRSVALVGAIPQSAPGMQLPTLALVAPLALPALSLAIISLVQSAGVSENSPNPDGSYGDASRDFIGQGVANLIGGLFRALPVGASSSGTALAINSGAHSRWANIFAGVLVAAATMAMAGLIGRLPVASLAGLLLLAGVRAIDGARVLLVLRTGRAATAVMLASFVATLTMPLHFAVLVGVGVSIVVYVWRSVDRVSLRQIVMVEGLPTERPAPRALPSHDVTVLLPQGSMFFAGARSLAEVLPDVTDTDGPIVLLLLRGRKDLGSTFIRIITRYATALRSRQGRLMLVGVNDGVVRQLRRTGALGVIGAQNVFPATRRHGEALLLAREVALARLGR